MSLTPKHEVISAIYRAHKIFVATVVAPGVRTTYVPVPKTVARALMKFHKEAFIENKGGDLFIGPAEKST